MQLRKKNVKISTPEFKEGQKKKNMLLQYYVNGKKKEIPPQYKEKNLSISVGPSILITNLHLYVLRSILHIIL